jgi:hypothetical protein
VKNVEEGLAWGPKDIEKRRELSCKRLFFWRLKEGNRQRERR